MKQHQALLTILVVAVAGTTLAQDAHPRIAVMETAFKKRADVSSFLDAKNAGYAAIQMHSGTPDRKTGLPIGNDPAILQSWKKASEEHGVKIISLCAGSLNNCQIWDRDRELAMRIAKQTIDACATLDARLMLFPFFGPSKFQDSDDALHGVAGFLKELLPYAESRRVVIGIEAPVTTERVLQLMDMLAFPEHLKIYYDTGNLFEKEDIYQTIAKYGEQHFCEVHIKASGHAIAGKGRIDLARLAKALDSARYDQWLVYEANRDGKEPIANRKRIERLMALREGGGTTVPTREKLLVYEGTAGIGKGRHIVFIANDHEYRSEQSCPLLAKILAKHHGFRCTVLFGIDGDGGIKAGAKEVPGMEALGDADLLVFFTRFMNLPDKQADMLVEYLERGGPIVGIRTSTHCFNGQKGKWTKLNFNYGGEDYRGGLGEQVFGNTWHKERGQSHYGSNHQMGCRITPTPAALGHPILRGVEKIHAYSGGYKSPPPAGSTPLLDLQVLNTFGASDDINKDKPIVSAGWTRNGYTAPSGSRKTGRVVYTSFGASEDLLSEDGRRFMVNACLWAAGLENAITPDLNVAIVGGFKPSPYTTGAFFYENVRPSDLTGFDSQIMPADAPLGGITNPRMKKKIARALENRPYLKAEIEKTHPNLLEAGSKGRTREKKNRE